MEFEVKSPILGFENVSKVRLEKIDDIFLNNVSGDLPSFTLVNPFALREYSFEIPTAIEVLLDIASQKSNNILIANVMVVYKKIKDSTINFLSHLYLTSIKRWHKSSSLNTRNTAYSNHT